MPLPHFLKTRSVLGSTVGIHLTRALGRPHHRLPSNLPCDQFHAEQPSVRVSLLFAKKLKLPDASSYLLRKRLEAEDVDEEYVGTGVHDAHDGNLHSGAHSATEALEVL